MSTITAIASLWKLCLVLLAFVFIIMYRPEIKKLLNADRIKVDKNGFEIKK